jgi:hypothetical protein
MGILRLRRNVWWTSDTGPSNSIPTASSMTEIAALPKFREQYLSRIANGSYSFSRVPGERPLPVFTTGSYGHEAEIESLKFVVSVQPHHLY